MRAHDGSSDRWIRLRGKAFFEGRGDKRQAVRLVNTVQDISDLKLWELNQKLLLGELSHRVKNMLSIVQAMARQTLRGSTDEKALASFETRLCALSGAHDLLMASNWKGADLAELIRSQLALLLGSDARQWIGAGPSVTLSPSLATSFGVVIHELATNALKYGSFSQRTGSVDLIWSVVSRDGGPLLSFRWVERGGPPVAEPAAQGFGSYLIEHGLPEARVRREFLAAGLVCTIEVPLGGTIWET
jgi:two-component system CheB/CheR fusion protein